MSAEGERPTRLRTLDRPEGRLVVSASSPHSLENDAPMSSSRGGDDSGIGRGWPPRLAGGDAVPQDIRSEISPFESPQPRLGGLKSGAGGEGAVRAPKRSSLWRRLHLMGTEDAMGQADNPGVVVWPPLLFLGAVLVALVLTRWLPLTVFPEPFARRLGALLLVVGVGLNVSSVLSMKRAGTHINPSRPATALVTSGPFRFSRNPIYVAGFTFLLGFAFAQDTLWAVLVLVPLAVALHYGVILREEGYLEGKFGEDYRAYCRAVRRYL